MMNAEALANRCTRCGHTFLECSGPAQCDRNIATDVQAKAYAYGRGAVMTTREIISRIALDARLRDDSSFSDTCRNAACDRVERMMDELVRRAYSENDAEAEAYLDEQNRLANEQEMDAFEEDEDIDCGELEA